MAAHPPHRDAPPPAPHPGGYLVRVDLVTLALHLGARDGSNYTVFDAARWLGQRWHGDNSPLIPTEEAGVFYTEESPRLWLDADEILSVRPTRKRKQYCRVYVREEQ